MKHTYIFRMFAFCLAALMLLSAVACGSSGKEETTTTAATNEGTTQVTTTAVPETESPYDENGYLKSSLPEDLNFNGETVTVLWWTDSSKPEFLAEEQTGDLNNDAIYQRNLNVQEKLGVTLAWDGIKGQYNNGVGAAYAQYVGNGYNAGDTTWDLMSAHSRTIALTAKYGYCANMAELDYLDFDMPWWPSKMIENTTIGNSIYFVTGDASVNALHEMYLIFYNKDMLNKYKLQDPTQLVKQGKWTQEAMKMLSKDLYQDLNNNGTKDESDVYGMSTLYYHFDAIYFGSDLKQGERDEENFFVISDDYFSEKATDINSDMGAWCQTPDVYVNSTYYADVFTNGNSLMVMCRHRDVADIVVGGDFSFGIVPIPKYNEEQETHITALGNPVSFYAIYGCSKDTNRAAAVLECWGAEGYRTTTPALFETTMKLKYSETSVESEMYNIIRENITFDFARMFAADLSGISDNYDKAIVNNSNWKTVSKTYEKMLPNLMKKITDAFKALEN